MTLTLRLFFFGLIAFIKQEGQLTVTLVSHNALPSLSSCKEANPSFCDFHGHDAALFALKNNLNCINPVGDICRVPIVGDIQVPEASGPLVYETSRRSASSISLPKTPLEGTDFSWLPSMRRIFPAGNSFDEHSPRIKSKLTLSSGYLEVCHLAELKLRETDPVESACDEFVRTDNVFRLRSLDGSLTQGQSQALADGVLISIDIQPTTPDTIQIALNGKMIQLQNPTACAINGRDGKCIDVAITNMPDPIIGPMHCAAIGLDFALLYDLSTNPPQDVCKRLVPRRTSTCIPALELGSVSDCSSSLTGKVLTFNKKLATGGAANPSPDSRPVCPMLVYGD
jgi:hypothetical protein